jgi:hypothetical protein
MLSLIIAIIALSSPDISPSGFRPAFVSWSLIPDNPSSWVIGEVEYDIGIGSSFVLSNHDPISRSAGIGAPREVTYLLEMF